MITKIPKDERMALAVVAIIIFWAIALCMFGPIMVSLVMFVLLCLTLAFIYWSFPLNIYFCLEDWWKMRQTQTCD